MELDVVIVEDELHTANMLQGMLQDLRAEWNVLAIIQSVKEAGRMAEGEGWNIFNFSGY